MTRSKLAWLMAFLGLCLPAVAARGQEKSPQITLRWHGQSFCEIESSKGTRLVIDPHAIEAYGRKSVSADLILITHLHNDHTQVGAVKNAAKAKTLYGVKGDGKRFDWNPIDETFRDVRVRTVGVYHDASEGMERGKNAVFIVEIDGLRVVHLGDLGHILTKRQVNMIGPVDVLLIPVGGVYTINGSEAKQVVEQLKPRRLIVPIHYGTKVYEDLLPADEFLEEQKNVKKYLSNKLQIDAVAPPPSQPTVALLDWKES